MHSKSAAGLKHNARNMCIKISSRKHIVELMVAGTSFAVPQCSPPAHQCRPFLSAAGSPNAQRERYCHCHAYTAATSAGTQAGRQAGRRRVTQRTGAYWPRASIDQPGRPDAQQERCCRCHAWNTTIAARQAGRQAADAQVHTGQGSPLTDSSLPSYQLAGDSVSP